MPQLDTVYILMIFTWTWLMLYFITQKTKTFIMTTQPMNHHNKNKKTLSLSWL